MNKFNKSAIGAVVAFAASVPIGAQAVTMTTGGDVTNNVTSFNWGPLSVYAQDGNLAFTNFINSGETCPNNSCAFQVYLHGDLDTFTISGGGSSTPAGLNSAYEITFEMGYGEKVVGAGIDDPVVGRNSAAFQFDGTQDSFFRMYYDTVTDSNQLAGTGFGSSGTTTLMLEGTILPVDDLSTFNANTTVAAIGGEDGETDPAWAGVDSVQGTGATGNLDVYVAPTYYDPSFFNGDEVVSFLLTGITQNLPFTDVDPSLEYPEGGTGNILAAIGAVNGGTTLVDGDLVPVGNSITFQSSPDSPITTAPVPLPGTLALLGLGIFGLGWKRRLV